MAGAVCRGRCCAAKISDFVSRPGSSVLQDEAGNVFALMQCS